MFEYFERTKEIIYSIFNTLKRNKNKSLFKGNEQYNKLPDKDESTLSLIRDNEINHNLYDIISENNVNLIHTETIFLVYSLLSLILLFGSIEYNINSNSKNNNSLFIEVGLYKNKFLSFFAISESCSFIFNLFNSLTSIFGFIIVGLMSKKIYLKHNSINKLKLIFTICLGVLTFLCQFIYGSLSLYSNLADLDLKLSSYINIGLKETVFFSQMILSLLFLTLVYIFNNQLSNENKTNNQYFSQIFCYFYFGFFLMCYLFIHLHIHGTIFKNYLSENLKLNYTYFLAVLPYLIYILNVLNYSLLYFDLENLNISLINSKKLLYERDSKNIL